jgi:hypothetical protein
MVNPPALRVQATFSISACTAHVVPWLLREASAASPGSHWPPMSVTGTVKFMREFVNSPSICILAIRWLRQKNTASIPVPNTRAFLDCDVHPSALSTYFSVVLSCSKITINFSAALWQQFSFTHYEIQPDNNGKLGSLPEKLVKFYFNLPHLLKED